jgi:diguanylate cyclase (GGDEF)-like protein/PAS domain S-box-containing protein
VTIPPTAGGPGDAQLQAELLAYLDESVVLIGTDGRIRARISAPGGLLGHGDVLDQEPLAWVHPDDLPAVLDFFGHVVECPPGTTDETVMRLRERDGSWASFALSVTNALGKPPLDGLVVRTLRLPSAAAGSGSRPTSSGPTAELVSLGDLLPVPVLVYSWNGLAAFANAAAIALLGRTHEELRSLDLADLADPATRPVLREATRALWERPGRARLTVTMPVRNRRSDEERIVEVSMVSHGAPGQVRVLVVVLDDVTGQRRRETELRHRADRDPLTGVLNRLALFEALAEPLRDRPEQVAVAYCDLDGFKEVNDTFGHDAGDRLLVRIATALQSAVRGGDLVARVGGDEFVAAFVDVDQATVERVVERMAEAVSASAEDFAVGISVGTVNGREGDKPEDLIRRADRAMYRHKRRRRQSRPRGRPDEAMESSHPI